MGLYNFNCLKKTLKIRKINTKKNVTDKKTVSLKKPTKNFEKLIVG